MKRVIKALRESFFVGKSDRGIRCGVTHGARFGGVWVAAGGRVFVAAPGWWL